MYALTKNIIPGCVVWANKKVYYDKPNEPIELRRSMFLITFVNEKMILGCSLTKNNSTRNRTVLYASHYPIKQDSRINEDLYELRREEILPGKHFVISERTFEYFKRSLHQRIAVDMMVSPKIYSDIFENEYLKDHYPKVDDIAVYPSIDKKFKYYYIYDEDEKNYFGVKLDRTGYDNYWIAENSLQIISKSVKFYDYYEKKLIERDEVSKVLLKK